jgi:hypothetical protein
MKPRTLVVHVDNDQWLISDKARAAAQAIPGGQYVGLSSPIAHYAVFSAPNTLKDDPTFRRSCATSASSRPTRCAPQAITAARA